MNYFSLQLLNNFLPMILNLSLLGMRGGGMYYY
ncbi:Uncharacterised protein [Nocardia otitidiscaviarum]|uniref:Uncharacterized protein n=1 Tax=Nocardia otitidiscaviarum TaxID=1823 RepID=A0A378YI50_9NOCA|nr:Uncharacterised protein [Nocardia otitidiscaviarum]